MSGRIVAGALALGLLGAAPVAATHAAALGFTTVHATLARP